MELMLIIYDVDFDDDIMNIINYSEIKGFSKWDRVLGRGKSSDPKMDNSVWPGFNASILVAMDEEAQKPFLESLRSLSRELGEKGLKVFMWPVREVI